MVSKILAVIVGALLWLPSLIWLIADHNWFRGIAFTAPAIAVGLPWLLLDLQSREKRRAGLWALALAPLAGIANLMLAYEIGPALGGLAHGMVLEYSGMPGVLGRYESAERRALLIAALIWLIPSALFFVCRFIWRSMRGSSS